MSATSQPLAAYRRILLIHFGQLGDSVLALPAAHALRARFPHSELVVLSSASAASVYRMAGFEQVWPVDRVRWKHHPGIALPEIAALVWKLRRHRFDLSVDLHTLKETNLLAWAAGIPSRLAMLRQTRSLPRLITLKPPPDNPDGVLLDRYCTVLQPLGIVVEDRRPRLQPPAAAIVGARQKLNALGVHEPFLGVCPGAGHPSRRWPAQRFVEVISALRASSPQPFTTLIFAGPEELPETLAAFHQLPDCAVVRGLSVPELTAALARCRVLVTNATGPSHLAAAVGTVVVSIGEIPAFDPVGRVRVVRARHNVFEIAPAAVLDQVRAAWAEPAPFHESLESMRQP